MKLKNERSWWLNEEELGWKPITFYAVIWRNLFLQWRQQLFNNQSTTTLFHSHSRELVDDCWNKKGILMCFIGAVPLFPLINTNHFFHSHCRNEVLIKKRNKLMICWMWWNGGAAGLKTYNLLFRNLNWWKQFNGGSSGSKPFHPSTNQQTNKPNQKVDCFCLFVELVDWIPLIIIDLMWRI